jgi:hypothetical protein
MIVAKSPGLTILCCNQHHFDCFGLRQEQVIPSSFTTFNRLKENTLG